MDKRSPYIDSPCIRKLLTQGRIPLLFIGSGLSKRYLQNYPSWDELMLMLSEELGISNGQILAMKQKITDENPNATKSKIFAEIGSNLTKMFREKVLNGDIKLEDIFSQEEISDIEKNNTTFIKMLISKKMRTYELSTNKKYASELTEFKKLQNNIGAVITTNYDQFLEKEIFTNFDVFVEQSQYYMTDCTGIGEIYKIHGSIESPNSIIFNSEDYENFNSNLKVIAAKLLNLALEYPIIFIGYSLEDENILKILETLVDSLNDCQLKNLSKNLVYVDWKQGEKRLRESKKTITREGKSLELTCISTDNYFVLYKHLSKFIPAEKPFSASSPSSCTDKINKETLDNAEFKRLVEYFRPHYRWMTLAGGTEPMLTPQISFDSNGTIYLTKRGYDLWTGNWKDYISASNPEDCKKSLEKFEQDLFGEYSGKLKISIEFIADHLIEFENSTDYTSDFTLSFSFPGHLTTGKQKELFIQELRKTDIFML